MFLCKFHEPGGLSTPCDGVELFAIVGMHASIGGFAETQCPIEYRVKNWREVAGRGIDDLQHFGGRGLLLQRFARFR
jgi:hypothetical protein